MAETKKNGLAIYAGGNHIFYIIGVLKLLLERGLKYDAVATYSSGSAILPFLIDNNFATAPEIFGELLDHNSRNFYPSNIFGCSEIFPHDQIYSTALQRIVDLQRTTEYNKPLRVIVSKLNTPAGSSRLVGLIATIALLLNSASKTATPSIFLTSFKRIFSIDGEIIDIRTCKSARDIIDTILGSSTIYPFINIRQQAGRSMLDGKLCLISPVEALDDCENILSIHGHHSFLPQRDNLTSIFPISKVSVGALNYVGAAGIFNTSLPDPDREIETLVVANPNTAQRQLLVELSPKGKTFDLGVDQSTAIELANANARTARLNIGERNVSIVTIVRTKEQSTNSTKAMPPAFQYPSSDSIMRQLATVYLIGLVLQIYSFFSPILIAWAALLTVSKLAVVQPKEWKQKARQYVTDIVRASMHKTRRDSGF